MEIKKIDRTKSSKFIFSSAQTMLLLEEYKKLKEQFRNPKVKKKDLWDDIREIFLENGFNPTAEVLHKKFRNVKQTYIQKKNRKNNSGEGAAKWEYYEICEEIFKTDETTDNEPTISVFGFNPLEDTSNVEDISNSMDSSLSYKNIKKRTKKISDTESEILNIERHKLQKLDNIETLLRDKNEILRGILLSIQKSNKK